MPHIHTPTSYQHHHLSTTQPSRPRTHIPRSPPLLRRRVWGTLVEEDTGGQERDPGGVVRWRIRCSLPSASPQLLSHSHSPASSLLISTLYNALNTSHQGTVTLSLRQLHLHFAHGWIHHPFLHLPVPVEIEIEIYTSTSTGGLHQETNLDRTILETRQMKRNKTQGGY